MGRCAASTYLAKIFGWIDVQRCTFTLVPPLNNGDNAAPASTQALVLAVVIKALSYRQ